MVQYIIVAFVAALVGYGAFWILLQKILPKRLRSDYRRQHEDILSDARSQAVSRKKTELERFEDQRQLLLEQLEADILERSADLKLADEDLDSREHTLGLEEARVAKKTKELEVHTQKVDAHKQKHAGIQEEITAARADLRKALVTVSGVEEGRLAQTITQNLIESRQIECQRIIRFQDDELSSSAKRLAERTLARGLSRYAPDFAWPKPINIVEIEDRRLAERIASPEGETLIVELKEQSGIELELLAGPENPVPILKLAGGAGINREATRLALNELLPKGAAGWAKAKAAYDRHRAVLEQEAVKLGRKAVIEVGLAGIHPEIQKLVGYLNWRTSYRQNQWHHTVEVAKLAGIMASEIGENVDAAKRVGLLHDIGKAIDYRIEGSHAIISGDYADRFGERRIICDTVMSHHNDLQLETPLAFILKTADTLSGARPGARVNLEEGYQMRLSGIEAAVRSFPGVASISIMNGAREVHVEVNHKRVKEQDLEALSQGIARRIEAEVAYPGEIKILVSRRFEATAVA